MKNRTEKTEIRRRSERSGTHFTLVEMLVVLVIMMIIIAVTLPAMKSFTLGSGVEGTARMVGAQLRLARQEAVSQRARIAVLFPTDNSLREETAYTAFRSCIVDAQGDFDDTAGGWVENAKWEFIPPGAVIADADDDDPETAGGDTSTGTMTTVDNVPNASGGRTNGVRAIIFRSTGRIQDGERVVTIVEGMVEGTTPQARNSDNWIDLVVDHYTGRVSYSYP